MSPTVNKNNKRVVTANNEILKCQVGHYENESLWNRFSSVASEFVMLNVVCFKQETCF